MEQINGTKNEQETASTTEAVADAKKVRRISNRQFATLRSRRNGAKKRVATFTIQRDEIKGIIRRRYIIINPETADKSVVRRLSRAELKEYRARLADVKTLLDRASADFRLLNSQYEAEGQKRQDASISGMQKQRTTIRATEKKDDLRTDTLEQLKHAASNGGRQMVQDLQVKIASEQTDAVKADLSSFMKANSPKLYEDVVASGVTFDRMVEKLVEDVKGIALSNSANIDEATRTITTLESAK
jgi:hypothetical protein